MRTSIVLLLAFFSFTPSRSQDNLDEWQVADRQVKRLPPSAFPQLPSNIQKWLERSGYTIPQIPMDPKPHNVITGSFKKKGQQDWAVLCSRNRRSAIIYFWAGSDKDTTEIRPSGDINWLQGGVTGIEFSRSINQIDRIGILSYNNMPDDSTTSWIDHDGVEDNFVDKASTVYYFFQDRCLAFSGAD